MSRAPYSASERLRPAGRVCALHAWGIVAALALASHHAEAARRFVEVGNGRGLEATVVPAMLVDRAGLLWIGSREGLYRYDGYLATAFRPVADESASVSDIDIRALYEARNGALWVSTNTAGLNRLDQRTGRFTRYRHDSADTHSLSDPSVYGVAEDARGRIWVGTQRGLNRLDADGQRFTRFLHDPSRRGSLANDWVYAVHGGRSGALWVGTVGGGIDRWDDAHSEFSNLLPSALTRGSRQLDDVFALHEAADGRLWAGTRGGLVVIDPAQRTARLIDLADDKGAQPLVTSMHADDSGRLWATTMQHGLIEVNLAAGTATRALPRIDPKTGSTTAQPLLSVATGRHHVFLGTWGAGVLRAPRAAPAFELLAQVGPGVLRNRNITAVMSDGKAGSPWVGSFGGGPQRVDVAKGTSIAPDLGAASETVTLAGVVSLAQLQGGRFFAGATEGLFGFDGDGRNVSLERHDAARSDGIGPGYVAALLPAGQGGLWVGVGGGGLQLRDATGRYRTFRHDPKLIDSLSGDYITALSPGLPGFIWVGTRSDGLNLCRIEPWSCQRDGADGRDGVRLANHHVTALRRDAAGTLWVATDGGGLHRITADTPGSIDTTIRWGAAEGLIDDGIMAVERDDDGSLWLSTRHGLARLDPETGRVVNHVAESGLPARHFNTGASAADASHVYFGSVEGLLSVPKGTPLTPRPATPVVITALERLGTHGGGWLSPAALEDGFETEHGNGVAVEFAVLDFAETTHEYAYRMQAQDPWTALGQRRQVTFLGLEPGQYRFEVRGRDVFGQWGTSRALSFEIVPPFWRTLWFRVLVAALLVLFAVGVHRARMRTLEARNAVLEDLERQRELALDRARASQHDLVEAQAGLRQLTGRLESAEEDERTRISRELHDEFGQTLTAAKITLQMLRTRAENSAVADGLTQSVSMVDGMIRQARDIARGLRPALLDEAGLVPALEHHLRSVSERSGVQIELHAGAGVDGAPPGLNTTVFRVVQEAVSNALRHAGANTIHVTLDAESDSLRLVVADDGVGFDVDVVGLRIRRGEHLGLLGMTERVRNAGGTIELDSKPAAGSRIKVRLPFAKPATAGHLASASASAALQ